MRPTFYIRSWRPRLRRGVAVLTAAVLGSAGLAAVAAAPASAAPVCQVAYTVNSDWGTGFSIASNITNNGPAITSWTLGYSYSGNQQLAQGWSGTWTQAGQAITVTNASWNGSLATGASTQIGANFSYTGTNTAPTAFTLNGTACNGSGGGGGTPTVSITSPANGATFTAPASIPITASASESGGTISKVEFFRGLAGPHRGDLRGIRQQQPDEPGGAPSRRAQPGVRQHADPGPDRGLRPAQP